MGDRKYLPTELVSEILSRLPVTSVCRFTCVCKSWYALINNPKFIATHRKNVPRNNMNSLFLTSGLGDNLVLYDSTFRDGIQIEKPFRIDCHYMFVGSCNGLICLTTEALDGEWDRYWGHDLYLWNPMIRRWKTLPSSSIFDPSKDFSEIVFLLVWFGFNEPSNDYKIIRVVYYVDPQLPPAAEVYSLSTDSWTTFDEAKVPGFADASNSARFCNTVYRWPWPGRRKRKFSASNKIFMSFNFNEELFRVIPAPSSCFDNGMSTRMISTVIKGLIPAFLTCGSDERKISSCELWMMNEDGNSKYSWHKKFHIEFEDPYMSPLGFIGDAKVLFTDSNGKLVLVDVENHQREAIGVYVNTWTGLYDIAFMESLALLDLGPACLGPAAWPRLEHPG